MYAYTRQKVVKHLYTWSLVFKYQSGILYLNIIYTLEKGSILKYVHNGLATGLMSPKSVFSPTFMQLQDFQNFTTDLCCFQDI